MLLSYPRYRAWQTKAFVSISNQLVIVSISFPNFSNPSASPQGLYKIFKMCVILWYSKK